MSDGAAAAAKRRAVGTPDGTIAIQPCSDGFTPMPTVTLPRLGTLRGEAVDGVARFLAIPYGRAARFGASRPAEPWAASGPRDNPQVLPICPQPPHLLSHPLRTFAGHRVEPSEADCLNLNVLTPAGALPADQSTSRRPVIFYIHGGAGKLGSCHGVDECNGQALCREHGVVHVACNYRLGALGWLAHEALLAEHDNSDCTGNFGLRDLVLALQWVRDHIAHFGGDPGNVTIWGLSTGSQLVATLLVCPDAAKDSVKLGGVCASRLFHKAVMQSCADLCNVRNLRAQHPIWLGKSACEWGAALGELLGCPGVPSGGATAAAQLEAMRCLPVQAFVDAAWSRESADCYEPATYLHPGSPKPYNSMTALSGDGTSQLVEPMVHEVPVMAGVTCEDGLGQCELEWTMFEDVRSVAAYERLLAAHFGTLGPAQLESARHAFAARDEAGVAAMLGDISEGLWYSAATHLTADLLATRAQASGHKHGVFLYRVTQPGFTRHGEDSPLFNGVPRWQQPEVAPAPGAAPPERAVAPAEPAGGDTGGAAGRVARRYLANFALTGDPNGEGLPRWEAHASGGERFMELGPRVGMAAAKHPDKERARFRLLQAYLREAARPRD